MDVVVSGKCVVVVGRGAEPRRRALAESAVAEHMFANASYCRAKHVLCHEHVQDNKVVRVCSVDLKYGRVKYRLCR